MRLLIGTFLCSFLLLAASAVDVGNEEKNLRSPRHTYNEHNDNSIKIEGFGVYGSAQINIGHGNRHKKDVEQDGEKKIDGELPRVKRWSLFGVKSKVENQHSTHTDNSIHANGANFGNSENVVIGHGNRLSKRSVDQKQVQDNVDNEELFRQKRWTLNKKTVMSLLSVHTRKEEERAGGKQ